MESLERFAGCLNDVIGGLTKSGHYQEVESVMTIEATLAKPPACLKNEWGDQVMCDGLTIIGHHGDVNSTIGPFGPNDNPV